MNAPPQPECEHPATEWKLNGGHGAHICATCRTILHEGPPATCEPCQRGEHALCPIFTCGCLHESEGDA